MAAGLSAPRAAVFLALLQLPILWIITSAAWQFWHRRLQQPACEMTYMYPDFRAVYAPEHGLDATHEHGYKLQAYLDHAHISGLRDQLVTPALFVPGNAGNFQQVRGLASETGRMWSALQTAYPGVPLKRVYIQWFSIDTGEELSAFNGPVLERQVQFTLSALRFLRHRYNLSATQQHRQGPGYPHPGVLLVGHSMGGVVARAALQNAATDPDLGPSAVALLLTLAAPLQRPPLPAHPSLQRFYAARRGQGPTPWVPLISLSGHSNDTQVSHHLTSPLGVHPAPISLHVSTAGVPGAWLAPTHVSFMWCNQLIKPVTRFLLEAMWQLHYDLGRTADSQVKDKGSNGSSGKRSRGHVVHLGNVSHVHHTSMVLAVARKHLLPNNLPQRLDAVWRQPPVPSTSQHSQPPQHHSIASLPEHYQCRGANLVWYRQYSQPKLVSCKGSHPGSSTPQGPCIPTVQVKGSKAAAKLAKLNVTGQLHAWALSDAGSTSYTWMLRASSAAPCRSFRVWLHPVRRTTGTTQAEDEAAWNTASSSAAGQVAGSRPAGTAANDSDASASEPSHVGSSDDGGRGSGSDADGVLPASGEPDEAAPISLTVSVGPVGKSESLVLQSAAQAPDARDGHAQVMLDSNTNTTHEHNTASAGSDSGNAASDGTQAESRLESEQGRGGSDASAGEQQEVVGSWLYGEGVEVTQLAAWLPPATAKARRVVRQWSDSDEILDGVDYNNTASWALVLPPSLLSQAAGITLWTGVPTNMSSFHLVAQLVSALHPAAAAHKVTPPAGSAPTSSELPITKDGDIRTSTADVDAITANSSNGLRLTWLSFLQPGTVPPGSPAVLPVHTTLDIRPLQHTASDACRQISRLGDQPLFTWAHQACQTIVKAAGSVAASCLHASGILDHVTLRVSAHVAAKGKKQPAKSVLDTCLHSTLVLPCGKSGTSGTSSECGDAAEMVMSNQTHFNLGPCMSGASGSTSCRLVLLTDPGCGYHVSLTLNMAEHLPGLLLANMHVMWLLSLGWLLTVMAVQCSRDNSSWVEATLLLHKSLVQLLCSATFLVGALLLAGLLLFAGHHVTQPISTDGADVETAVSVKQQSPWMLRDNAPGGYQITSLWMSLLPVVAVICGWSQPTGKGLNRAWVVTSVATGAALPWLVTSPRLNDHLSRPMSHLGAWVCSTQGCLASHQPSPVELALLAGCSAVLVVVLHAAVCLLEQLVRLVRKPFTKRTPRASPSADTAAASQASQPVADNQHGQPGSIPDVNDHNSSKGMADKHTSRISSPASGSRGVGAVVVSGVLITMATVIHLALGLFIAFLVLLMRTQAGRVTNDESGTQAVGQSGGVKSASVGRTGRSQTQQVLVGWTRVLALSVVLMAPSLIAAVHELKRHGLLISHVSDVVLLLPVVLTSVLPVRARLQAGTGTCTLLVAGLAGTSAACLSSAVLGLDFASYHVQCVAALLMLLACAVA